MNRSARTHITTPILVGRNWLFADGTRLPVVAGADGDETITVPEDLTTVAPDDLAALEAAIVAEFDRLHDEGGTSAETIAEMTALADALDRISTENGRRETEAAEAQAQIDALRTRVHATDGGDDDGDGPDDGDDPGDGEPEGDPAPEGAAATPELVTASGRPVTVPARRAPASASATARRAPRATPPARLPVTITAAADIAGIQSGAAITQLQVATAMHERARALSNGAPRVPVARFNLPYAEDQMIRPSMSAEAQQAVIDRVTDQSRLDLANLTAAGGWCTPSQNLYDLFALTGQNDLFDVPSIGIERGGVNIPSYIGLDAADGALWSWSEDQDEATTITITDLDASSGTATVTTNPAHLLNVGDVVDISVGNVAVDGPQTVLTTPTATTFTFASGATVVSATGTGLRQKGCYRIPCPTWTDYRLAAYGLCLSHGNLSDKAFPELTRRYVALAMDAHMHRMSSINLAKIEGASNSEAVTVTSASTDTAGEVLNALDLQVQDYRSEHLIDSSVVLEAVFPAWIRANVRATLAMRAGVDLLSVSDAQIAQWFADRNVRPQFPVDYQPLHTGTPATAWPSTARFLLYPAGNFVEGNGGTIDLGVVRDSRLNATNDFTAAWSEQFSLLARRGPLARKVTFSVSTDGVTACCP